MKIRPLHDNVLVQLDKPNDRTTGGLHIPETARAERSVRYGRVEAVAEGLEDYCVKVGDQVILAAHAGAEMRARGDVFEGKLIVKDEDILAVIEAD